ncbi:protein farnesyltransferase subunit beta [Tanacetum coccineum]
MDPSPSSPAPEYKPTKTQEEQWALESQVFHNYNLFCNSPPNLQAVMLEVQRDNHIEYLMTGLRNLGPSFVVLDASRPWLCYWILHSLALLGECVDVALEHNAIDFLSRCQDEHGGYGGGPGQARIKPSLVCTFGGGQGRVIALPHLCTTYAAVNSLITLGGHRSLKSINSMHDGGEIDVRACYTAISVASVLNILDEELTQGVGNYISRLVIYNLTFL